MPGPADAVKTTEELIEFRKIVEENTSQSQSPLAVVPKTEPNKAPAKETAPERNREIDLLIVETGVKLPAKFLAADFLIVPDKPIEATKDNKNILNPVTAPAEAIVPVNLRDALFRIFPAEPIAPDKLLAADFRIVPDKPIEAAKDKRKTRKAEIEPLELIEPDKFRAAFLRIFPAGVTEPVKRRDALLARMPADVIEPAKDRAAVLTILPELAALPAKLRAALLRIFPAEPIEPAKLRVADLTITADGLRLPARFCV